MKILFLIMLSFASLNSRLAEFRDSQQDGVNGSWRIDTGSGQMLMIIEEGYYAVTAYNISQKQFHGSYGGRIQIAGDSIFTAIEFNSKDSSKVGSTTAYKFNIADDQLFMYEGTHQIAWTKADDPDTPLTGCWRISGRMDGEKLVEIKPTPRQTLKILSGSNFQWIAMNTQTGQFFGTGGGSYTFRDGKYTEIIEFFSRDSSRVGASLTFDAKVEDGIWHHSGLSSSGKPVKETWARHDAKN